ncbi:PilZ domain-containing protein [Sphingomonas morindae]|uniref:PilZ domain-containing protein n=1 Tax=Sphingomonas morindae TaxID=1541170 RepID=A0ABY4X5E5_9SPHN|nr:PilZ domain-containing protein [Sphingomonas morindae]USI72109.1 PilZ domain-containing protein [Sphingomonas morindae]
MIVDDTAGSGRASDSSDSQRRDERDSLLILARLQPDQGGAVATVRVRNVSSGGLMAEAPDGYHPGTRVLVELDGIGVVAGAVAWAEAGRIGIAFDHPIDKARARKPVAGATAPTESGLFRPVTDFRRPAVKPR